MRGQNFLPATASPADSARSILICRGNFETDQHLCLAFLFHKDYFARSDAPLSGSFAPQGLFRPVRCISILLFCSTGIISTSRMHLYPALLLHRDYFHRPNASLSGFFASQGLFQPAGCISILLFAPQGLFRPSQIRPPSLKTSLPVHSVNCRFLN